MSINVLNCNGYPHLIDDQIAKLYSEMNWNKFQQQIKREKTVSKSNSQERTRARGIHNIRLIELKNTQTQT